MTLTTSRTPKPAKLTAALAACAVASLAVVATSQAFADEAFVCGDGSVVNVKPGQLEIVKRTNPCVARYFGLDVSTNDAEAAKAIAREAAALLRGKEAGAMDPPARNPSRVAKSDGAEPESPAESATNSQASLPVARPGSPIETGSTRRMPSPAEQPATDYRNVRIINAGPGQAAVFHHNR